MSRRQALSSFEAEPSGLGSGSRRGGAAPRQGRTPPRRAPDAQAVPEVDIAALIEEERNRWPVSVFVDTSVLAAGLIDFGPQSAPAQSLLHAIAERQLANAATAWHCCLGFFSVATRLPPEFRLTPADAGRLLAEEVFERLLIHDLPPGDRIGLLRAAVADGTAGGRIYDAHIAEVARAGGANVILTDSRHFLGSLRHGLRVETPAEFLKSFKGRR